jgi:RNA polymerase sigma factor (sigma-70 family)
MGSPSDASIIEASGGDPAAFGHIFDRHATTVHRYLLRRVGASDADGLLGETFRIAFERRSSYDLSRENARPWLYGIATNLIARHHRSGARESRATARLHVDDGCDDDVAERVTDAVAAASLLPGVLDAVRALPRGERDALLLHVWEDLRYEEIAAALDIPVGTVRSRLNRARTKLRELQRPRGEHLVHADVYTRQKEQLMSTIDKFEQVQAKAAGRMYPRLAYRDERAALEWLIRVFGFTERREARMESNDTGDDNMLAWLEFGDGLVMIGHSNEDVHRISSPIDRGGATSMINVDVDDIDAHYERAVREGAEITMPIEDAFYGSRRYEASDLEGHRWHFDEPHERIRARGGVVPE